MLLSVMPLKGLSALQCTSQRYWLKKCLVSVYSSYQKGAKISFIFLKQRPFSTCRMAKKQTYLCPTKNKKILVRPRLPNIHCRELLLPSAVI